MIQPVGRQESVIYVGCKKIRRRDANGRFHMRRRHFAQNAICEHHSRRLAADFSITDLVTANLAQICHREPVPGNVEISQLVADHGTDKHHLDFLQARFKVLALLRRHTFDGFSLLKEHILWCQFGIKSDHVGNFATLTNRLPDNIFKFIVRQIVGKIEICQRIADTLPPFLP